MHREAYAEGYATTCLVRRRRDGAPRGRYLAGSARGFTKDRGYAVLGTVVKVRLPLVRGENRAG